MACQKFTFRVRTCSTTTVPIALAGESRADIKSGLKVRFIRFYGCILSISHSIHWKQYYKLKILVRYFESDNYALLPQEVNGYYKEPLGNAGNRSAGGLPAPRRGCR